jgi:SPP1 gp7 family putative phage head morphogenesis protein
VGIDKHIAKAMGLRDDELDYVYQNPEGDIVFLPIMQIYNDAFFEAEYKNITNWAEAYVNDNPTALYERYILNYTQFSAAKTLTEAKELQKLVFDNDGKVKPIGRFIDEANEYKKQISDTWLRVEYDNAIGNAVMADKWQQIEEDKDIYPYWKYETMHDSRVRHDHAELDGKVFEIGDEFGDSVVPRNDWNCRCRAVSTDHGKPQTKAQSKELLEKYVNEQFRFNPAKQGMFPKKDCPYIEALNEAKGKASFVDLPKVPNITPFEEKYNQIKSSAKELDEDLGSKIRDKHDTLMELRAKYSNLLKEEKKLWKEKDLDNYTIINNERKDTYEEMKKHFEEKELLEKNYSIKAAEILKNSNPSTKFETTASKAQYKSLQNLKQGEEIFRKIVSDKMLTSEEKCGVKGLKDGSRARYRLGEIAITKTEPIETICHELGHFLEATNKEYFEEIKAFYERRTKGEPLKKLNKITKLPYKNNEVAKEDKFKDPYIGKWYENHRGEQKATEITSMWFTQSLKDLHNFIKDDEDYFISVYKLLNK